MKNALSPESERNKARSLVTNSMVPGSMGFFQLYGGFGPPDNLRIGSATHLRPSKLVYWIPQWVNSSCE